MSRRWVEHTGELELAIEAPNERAAFEEAFEAMRELLAPEGDSGVPAEHGAPAQASAVSLRASDRTTLLADWVGELAFLAETEGLVPERLVSLELDDAGLEATVEGFHGEPPHLVKAATYHRLALEPVAGGGVRATVILDV